MEPKTELELKANVLLNSVNAINNLAAEKVRGNPDLAIKLVKIIAAFSAEHDIYQAQRVAMLKDAGAEQIGQQVTIKSNLVTPELTENLDKLYAIVVKLPGSKVDYTELLAASVAISTEDVITLGWLINY